MGLFLYLCVGESVTFLFFVLGFSITLKSTLALASFLFKYLHHPSEIQKEYNLIEYNIRFHVQIFTTTTQKSPSIYLHKQTSACQRLNQQYLFDTKLELYCRLDLEHFNLFKHTVIVTFLFLRFTFQFFCLPLKKTKSSDMGYEAGNRNGDLFRDLKIIGMLFKATMQRTLYE